MHRELAGLELVFARRGTGKMCLFALVRISIMDDCSFHDEVLLMGSK